MHSIVRDFICVILLLVLDLWILTAFRRMMRNKKRIIVRRNSTGTCSLSDKVEKAENKTTLMILLIGLMTIIGRLPIFVNYLPIKFSIKACYQFASETLYFLNISLNFFIYYFFNTSFKSVLDEALCRRRSDYRQVPNTSSIPMRRRS